MKNKYIPDRYVGILLKNGTKLSVEAYDTESPFLCVSHANDNVRWTVVSIKTGATFGAFNKIIDAKNIVKILMQYNLDRLDKPVRGKEWNKLGIDPEVKTWLLEVSSTNR